MVQVHLGWFLEAEHLTARRVNAPHDGPNGAVLAGGVHALKDDQQCVAVAGPEDFLQFVELFDRLSQTFLGFPLLTYRSIRRCIK